MKRIPTAVIDTQKKPNIPPFPPNSRSQSITATRRAPKHDLSCRVKADANVQPKVKIVNSQSAQRHRHHRGVAGARSDMNAHGFLLFEDPFAVALFTGEHPLLARAATALTGTSAGNDKKNNPPLFGFSERQDHPRIQTFTIFLGIDFGAGKTAAHPG